MAFKYGLSIPQTHLYIKQYVCFYLKNATSPINPRKPKVSTEFFHSSFGLERSRIFRMRDSHFAMNFQKIIFI